MRSREERKRGREREMGDRKGYKEAREEED